MKLRVAIVVSHPIQHFCPQYRSFSKLEGVSIKVFFASALGLRKYTDPNFKKEISWGNLHLDEFDHTFLNGDVVLPSDSNLDAKTLECEVVKFAPDLVIIYGYFQKLQRRAHTWAFKNKIKIAYISDSELRHQRNSLKEFIKFLFIKRYFSRIDYFLSVGDANESFYKYYGVSASKFVRMHFPIDLHAYKKAFESRFELRVRIREKFKIETDDVVLSVVGKLVPWKNQEHIIEALRRLERKHIYLNLFIIGSGSTQPELERKAQCLTKSKIHFPGFVQIDELPSYYAATDIYVHPASVEPHSIAISEAIYMGCPIIISDRCGSYGAHDDVQEGKNGFVFPFGDVGALCDAIEKLLDANTRQQFGACSHEISKRFQEQAHEGVLQELRKKVQA